jgi:hypothetical protein
LKTDPSVCPGDQGNGFVQHSNLLCCNDVWRPPPPRVNEINGTTFRLYGTMFRLANGKSA